jgi:hypothetical protein
MKSMGVNRWDPSVRAIDTITKQLQDKIRFGLMAFPSTQDRQFLNCTPGRVEQDVKIDNADPIARSLQNIQPGGYTPTAPTLEAAHKALGAYVPSPDEFIPAKYVLLVTDGQPNCTNGVAGSGDAEPAAVDASVAAIEAMAKDGIKTYVVGYDTQNDPALKATLDRMAQAGDTGDKEHRPVESEETLFKEFSDIAGKAVTCSFALDTVPMDVHRVEVKMNGKQLNLNDPNGWSLSSDGRSITIGGDSCTALKNGSANDLAVRELCDDVPPVL